MKNKNTKGNLSSRELILIFVLLATGILVTGNFSYSIYEKNYRTQVEHQLSAITDLKVAEIVQWRKERLGDASLLYKNPAFSSLVQRYLEHPDDLEAQTQLRSWFTRYQLYDQYSSIFLLDTLGIGRISVPDTAGPIPRHIPQDAQKVLQSGKVTVLDLDRDEDTPQSHMAILIPIFSENDGNPPLGVVVMRIDPYVYLYPLISRWPTPSTTAETLLVRREGNEALFLNELRFQKDTALKLRTSLDNITMPAVQAALGHEGIMEGIDYRGVPVIADMRAVPDSPWFLVARMDTSEVYAPLTQLFWLIIALVGGLLIGAGAGVGLVWRQQNIRVYKERVEVLDALRESGLRYRDLVNNSKNGVAIYEASADGEDFIIRDFNRAAESIENVKKEDIIGKSILQVFPGAKEFGLIEVLQRVWRTGVPVRHPLRWYRDERISGWRDSYVYRLSSGEIVAIYEDVTARKLAEEALLKSNNLLNRIIDQSPISMWISDEKGTLIKINRACCELLNITEKEVLGKYNIFQDNIVEKQGFMPQVKSVFEEGKTVRFELRYDTAELESLQLEGRVFVILDISIFPIIDTDGHIINAMIHQSDITGRKQAEENLEKSSRELRNLSAHLISLREEERTLLAREIHDELGQALTALKMDLSWLSKKSPQGPNGEKIATMLSLVNTTMKMVKRLSTELRPGLLDDLGLVAAMEWQAGEFQERTGIKTELGFEPYDIMVDNEQATALFRIFQEVLTNVARHAVATSIEVYLHEKDGALEMNVRDNGKGIEPKMITSSKSLGLIGMRERCNYLGGTIDIRGKLGKGTTVIVKLPAGEKRA